MTVIYSNFGDNDTAVLPLIWEGLPNVTVIEITRDTVDYENMVDAAIANETDTILFCGHGSEHGLLHPNLDSGQYILHELNCHLIHARRVIGFWCYASFFAEAQHLNGFFSSMYISNLNEAYSGGYTEALATDIDESIRLFSEYLNGLLRADVSLEDWIPQLMVHMRPELEFEVYNYFGLRYFNCYEQTQEYETN
jgi:hypothetical protein